MIEPSSPQITTYKHHPRVEDNSPHLLPSSLSRHLEDSKMKQLYTILALVGVVTASLVTPLYDFGKRAPTTNGTCDTNQNAAPGDLTSCGNSTLFFVWRPKARFIAPEGWMNDPQGQ